MVGAEGLAYNSRRLPAARSQAAARGAPHHSLVAQRCALLVPTQAKQLACSATGQQMKKLCFSRAFSFVGAEGLEPP